ncbi:prepilin-type N-terminal cleavage/methylation domain-containing protein [Leifsonia sp. TF02-11]|uniref:prepilin-type N-terminal cleavage/methylation domain-containing protein n=1 Tax=Leifsonia sp. TF02-11 TaxID=2815212 RepID=UPI001AA0DCF7|nr:prepilin-type N-terminal cleavage/methylation domain-containing protein [Leifsonia sp. TF02-11]MBO1740299.1 prepilin-type N-terminal cleavage/methylation domain-containing protein [Leifsonia sp. TF02-11]
MNVFRSFCHRLSPIARSESGLTLIEILVAMTIFGIISVGIAAGVTASLVNVRDSRNRETALNLAASQIDLMRSVKDVFSVNDTAGPTNTVVGGVTYHLTRTTNWVTSSGGNNACGANGAGATLLYKRVTVKVTWDGMRNSAVPAVADTLLAPKSRINDPTKGTILVHVFGVGGADKQDIVVNAAPTPGVPGNTAVALTVTPSNTDIQGCSYILKVTPGTYDVTVSKAGYIGADNVMLGSDTQTIGVGAGASASASFQFDNAGLFPTALASNAGATTGILFPSGLDLSFLNSFGPSVTSYTGSAIARHPFIDGYTVLAGKYINPAVSSSATCLAIDPQAWPSKTVGANTYTGKRPVVVAAQPGQSAPTPAQVGMGVFTVVLNNANGAYINAVAQSAITASGNPGCQVAMSYSFGSVVASSTNTTFKLALPWGSWKLYQGTTNTATTNQVGNSGMTAVTGTTIVKDSSNVLTLDPRTTP